MDVLIRGRVYKKHLRGTGKVCFRQRLLPQSESPATFNNGIALVSARVAHHRHSVGLNLYSFTLP